jgi:hypothetical protein
MTHISGFERSQILLLPEAVDDYVGADNPVRFPGPPATTLHRNELLREAAFSPPERVYGPQRSLTETTPAGVWAGIFCFAAPREAPVFGKSPRRALGC